ncbi:putative two-component response regulator [Anaerocolumna chitinilytica]|uniref:Stage 0 sporulation protein A homolog n=2 Tax=Anaerocolumna chitinilytica TaxID=1727145 RepID=A0A7I8DS14_9FIRM|nr:putative two-component response regulator [Anaerocolumna chitinilytica]
MGCFMEKEGLHLLIADDEENILTAMVNYIRKNTTVFTRIDSVSNGQEALDLIYRNRPDVMLLDVQMPVKTGIEVMEESRVAGICPETIILSGYDTFSYAQQAIRLGARDYLLKPCKAIEILTKLESFAVQKIKKNTALESEKNYQVKMAKKYIKEHLTEELSLALVAERVGLSMAYLSTLFTQNLGCGFVDYLNQERINRACAYMHDGKMKVYEIAFKVGFHDDKYFSRVFKKVTGMSPSVYRQNIGIYEEESMITF